MGCDIHCYAEKKFGSEFEFIRSSAEDLNRNYSLFGWLANVRNYSALDPLDAPRGLPNDLSGYIARQAEAWGGDGHSHSWFSLEELFSVEYDQEIIDRRVTRQIGPNSWSGAETAEEGRGERMTLEEFLGGEWEELLQELEDLGAERIVFWFDN